ncbi:PucR family transcriptional regulator [Paludifilum halophilum]|uniref:PucR family transcriptional regulator n=1 Tax=Paludifilum halophilum TaxID=1642702 RepID=A0A235BAB4_9BACL|nr:PucR family transcriptional regulator [Paludifilum halophilum]OYD08827.1 hypothetical protein CHM34_03285 [Paludifilum halophilum]
MLTVENILQLDVMHGANVKTSETKGLHNPVEQISVIEVPVENFVRKNEMVLSTAVGCGHDPHLFYDFIQALIESGAAALVLATGHYITEIPEEAIQLAEQKKMPIIEIPWKTRFADIVHRVIRELDHRQDQMTHFSKETQEELLQLILQGANLTKLAGIIFRKLRYPVIFVDQKGKIKGNSPSSQPLVRFWSERFKGLETPDTNHIHGEWKWYGFDGRSCIEIPIRSARKVQGSLFLLLPKGADSKPPLDRAAQIYLDHAATAAALCFLQENVAAETEMRLRSDFVWSLAKGEIGSEEAIRKKADALGYDANRPYVCILGLMEQKNDSETFIREPPLQEILDEIAYTSRSIQRNIMTTRQLDQFILYLETPEQRVIDTVQTFLDILEGRVYERFPEWSISWGIGESRAGINTFRESYLDARTALDIGRRQKGPGHRNFYMDTGLYRALQHLSEHPDMREITWSSMGRLLGYSKQRGIDLVETFTSYLRNQCNVSQTARELNLHRQSLLYRLRKIESLTGRSLLNPDDLFLLQLSIKLWSSKKEDEYRPWGK